MRISIWSWCVINVASIWKNGWVNGGHKAVSIFCDFLLYCIRNCIRNNVR